MERSGGVEEKVGSTPEENSGNIKLYPWDKSSQTPTDKSENGFERQ